MPTSIKVILALLIIGLGIAYWHVRSTIEPVQFTPTSTQQIQEKTPS